MTEPNPKTREIGRFRQSGETKLLEREASGAAVDAVADYFASA
jgi:hypothetical protein